MLLSVQYLRAVAATAVVVFHLFPVFFPEIRNPLSSGAAGVDIFFVISGFIMWHITRDRSVTSGEFLANRVIRVAPLYWLVTLTLALAATLKPNLFPLDQPTPSHVVLSMLFIPHINPVTSSISPLVTQGWTLNYEALFYLSFAATLFFVHRRRLAVLSILILTPVLLGFLIRPGNIYLAWLTSDLLMEFYLGVVVAILIGRGTILPKGAAALICIVSFVVIFSLDVERLHMSRLLVWGLPSALLVWSAISLEKHGRIAKYKIFLLLGNASYSIYLVHFLAQAAVCIVLGALGLSRFGAAPYALAVVVAIGGGILTYLFFERPLAKAMKGVA